MFAKIAASFAASCFLASFVPATGTRTSSLTADLAGVTGSKLAVAAAGSQLVEFLNGTGQDHRGRYLQDLWQFDIEQMESSHDYIQWMFPSDEKSMYNRHAPVFTVEDQEVVKSDEGIKANLRKSLKQFLNFIGLSFSPDGKTVVKAANFSRRLIDIYDDDYGDLNHNWLRITRVLRCLKLAGFEAEAHALLKMLEEIVNSEDGEEAKGSFRFWKKALE
mmetsp:Transcript_91785/g.163355  ORF Transcript_91785/g.163355 Transcript_91785/m.163355 type:complete len:219 (+) Transcript_91785:60-716(+)|eukprot:CAMPEP_0197621946 /NCGR_PEP_ID=MMETSP1338-20131121/2365_1 /TAXON_ID=43686 ORGANISM="Pelagodinium beii, Strain RCC1491" /NCGR_SAMPLE_ID=MMETSP1338 /ASSEMBLY_ACC=CAM_ASM_000754 /LENGTH=218 /DNA_ID=CAMNT_0043191531 /DNA_START=60 /DNA_END=716 /DNA_ORIENTATION=-